MSPSADDEKRRYRDTIEGVGCAPWHYTGEARWTWCLMRWASYPKVRPVLASRLACHS